ncbi:MAG: Ig-like domain-containing protein [bacterium]
MFKIICVLSILSLATLNSCDDGPTESDTTAPSVVFDNSPDGSTVSGVVDVAVIATDNIGVARVEFYVDTALIAVDSASPWVFSWNTGAHGDGLHSIWVVAFDVAGNKATTDTIEVGVFNIIINPNPPLIGDYHGLYSVTAEYASPSQSIDSCFVVWTFTEQYYIMKIDTARIDPMDQVCFCRVDGVYATAASITLRERHSLPDGEANCTSCNETYNPTGSFIFEWQSHTLILNQLEGTTFKELRLVRDQQGD